MSDSAAAGAGNDAQGEPAIPTPSPAHPGGPSGHETVPPATALTRREKNALRPRIDGVLAHRHDRFRKLVEIQLIKDAKDVAMRQYAFLTDDELEVATYNGKPLTKRQKRLAREWEKNKRDAALALSASNDIVVNAMRAQQVQPGVTVNVERAIIRVPDTKPDADEDPIVIDVEATLAPG